MYAASSDDTVQFRGDPLVTSDTNGIARPMPPLMHPTAVRAVLPLSLSVLNEPYILTGSGDVIRAYDVSSLDAPELLSETDAHWHDVIRLRLWMRRSVVESQPGKWMIEPWVVSASLDGTLRRWRLLGMLPYEASTCHIHTYRMCRTIEAISKNSCRGAEDSDVCPGIGATCEGGRSVCDDRG